MSLLLSFTFGLLIGALGVSYLAYRILKSEGVF